MRRIVAMILMAVVLSGCSSFVDKVQDKAQAKFQSFLGKQFGKRLESGIGLVIAQLSKKGGFLDDPLVRILLPPPLGMAVGIVREFQNNPQATLLSTLINQAAENAIPVAGPILTNIVKNMDGPSLQHLLDGGPAAATDYLKEKGGAMVAGAVLPAITKELHANGAIELYGKLLEVKQTADQVTATAESARQQVAAAQQQVETIQQQAAAVAQPQAAAVAQPQAESTQPVETAQQQAEVAQQQVAAVAQPQAAAVQAVSQEQLGQYVAEQAMSGLFKKVADQELAVRGTLDALR